MKFSRFLRLSGLFLLLNLCFIPDLRAQDNSIKFSTLDIEDGLSQSTVNAILQDTAGFIWIGTQDGLNRFDGYEFQVYRNSRNANSLSDNFVHSLAEDAIGNLWVGTERGLNMFDRLSGKVIRIPLPGSLPGGIQPAVIAMAVHDSIILAGTATGEIFEVSQDKIPRLSSLSAKIPKGSAIQAMYIENEKLWIGTAGHGVYRISLPDSSVNTFSKSSGKLSSDLVRCITGDGRGGVWIGTHDGLTRISENIHIQHYRSRPANMDGLSDNEITSIYTDKSNAVWIGTGGKGLNKLDQQGRFTHYVHSSFITGSLSDNTINTIYEDRSGILWFGTNRGISKFDNTRQHFLHNRNIPYDPATLSHDMVWSIMRDRSGNLWAGHHQGVDVLDKNFRRIKTITPVQGNESERGVFSMLHDSQGVYWLGTDRGIYFSGDYNKPFRRHTAIGGQQVEGRVYALKQDREGRLWVGTRHGLYLIDESRRQLKVHFAGEGSLSNNTIRCFLETDDGMLAGTGGAGIDRVRIVNDSLHVTEFYAGSSPVVILDLYQDARGRIWAGTYGQGVLVFSSNGSLINTYTEENGLSNNVVYSVYEDLQQRVWMSTNKGLNVFDPTSGHFSAFFQSHGLQSNEFNTGAHFRDEDGTLYFGGINGFNSFHPERLNGNSIPPQMVITGLNIFNRPVLPGDESPLKNDISVTKNIELSWKDDVITLEFAGLHYSSPEQNTYAYMLEGFDREWILISGQRQVTYTNLDPGEYTFRVKGANSDGVWSKQDATLQITITPPFWSTWWFRGVALGALLLSAYAVYRSRIAMIEAQKKQLVMLVRERTAKVQEQKSKIEAQNKLLESEKEKVEKLLLNIFPQETVEELKNKGKASARHYRMSTVMFTDFKGFTRIAEKIRPKDLVAELDRYFIRFDEIIGRYGLEKIKTMGDAYLAAGGIPIRNKSNPIDTVRAALEIQRFMKEVSAEKMARGEPVWELRIGIHTGELIAGVVGTKRFAYDIWGDTVNVASRMESNGDVGRVNISGVTYSYVRDFFTCTYRGKINAKNKGDTDMYFVEGIAPELSVDGAGIEPNEKFHAAVATALFYKINYRKAEQFILKKLEQELPSDLYYHGLHHTIDVRDAADRIGKYEGIAGEDLMVLKTAAMYHDAGFVEQYFHNEPVGVRMAEEILPDFGYSPDQIKQITQLILATQVPQKPSNLMEMVLCDADLDYLGREDFNQIADSLMHELMARGKVKNQREWDEIQISFLESHHYFTSFSIEHRNPVKQQHLEAIKQRYRENRYELTT